MTTDCCPNTSFQSRRCFLVYPDKGVPPADILAIAWPEMSLEDRQTLTKDEYANLKALKKAEVDARADNLAGTGKRKKRETTQPEATG